MPHKKKINDDETLLRMHTEGAGLKEIAQHFNVSAVAVYKRLKRLTASSVIEEVQRKHDLTDKELSFAIEKARGKSNTQAVLASQYEVSSDQSAKVIGSQLMDKPEIVKAIDDLMNQHGLTKSYRIGKLRQHVDSRDSGISLKALDQTWRLDGSYAPIPIYVDNTREHLQGISERLKDMMSQIKQSVREEVMRELKEKSLLPDNFIDVTEESEKEPVL